MKRAGVAIIVMLALASCLFANITDINGISLFFSPNAISQTGDTFYIYDKTEVTIQCNIGSFQDKGISLIKATLGDANICEYTDKSRMPLGSSCLFTANYSANSPIIIRIEYKESGSTDTKIKTTTLLKQKTSYDVEAFIMGSLDSIKIVDEKGNDQPTSQDDIQVMYSQSVKLAMKDKAKTFKDIGITRIRLTNISDNIEVNSISGANLAQPEYVFVSEFKKRIDKFKKYRIDVFVGSKIVHNSEVQNHGDNIIISSYDISFIPSNYSSPVIASVGAALIYPFEENIEVVGSIVPTVKFGMNRRIYPGNNAYKDIFYGICTSISNINYTNNSITTKELFYMLGVGASIDLFEVYFYIGTDFKNSSYSWKYLSPGLFIGTDLSSILKIIKE